jgi:hypothetical protein
VVDLQQSDARRRVAGWLDEQEVRTLNVAGPRESQSPGIAELVRRFLVELLKEAA